MKAEKGFTLIELLVVIAVIAVLMGILMPVLGRAKEAAKRVVCSNQVRQVGVAITSFATDYDGRMPLYTSDTGSDDPYALTKSYVAYRDDWVDSAGKPLPMKLAVLYEDDYIVEPEVFYCPSNRNDLYRFESYNNPSPWGTLPQNFNTNDGVGDSRSHNQWVRMGYTYLPVDLRSERNNNGTPERTARRIDQLDTYLPYMTDVVRHLDEISHTRKKQAAVNALYKDGHVTLHNEERIFTDQTWDLMEYQVIDEEDGNYRVFRLIAGWAAEEK